MRTSSKILLAVAVIAALVLIAIALRPKPLSPEQQIQNQTESAVAAANEHNASGIMAIVSADYMDQNGYNVDLIHALLVRGLRNTPALHASFIGTTITVQGNKATSQGYLTVQDEQSGHTLFSREVTLQWQKEHARSYVIYPTDVWRVVSADYGSAGGDSGFGI